MRPRLKASTYRHCDELGNVCAAEREGMGEVRNGRGEREQAVSRLSDIIRFMSKAEKDLFIGRVDISCTTKQMLRAKAETHFATKYTTAYRSSSFNVPYG